MTDPDANSPGSPPDRPTEAAPAASPDAAAEPNRPPNPPGQAIRQARPPRSSLDVAAVAVAVTLLLVALGLNVGPSLSQPPPRGEFLLTTEGPPLVAEVLDDRDRLVLPRFTVPTQQPRVVAPGLYRVRLSSPGRLSETYQLLVEEGTRRTFQVNLGGRKLWEPVEVAGGYDAVDLDGRSDLIRVTESGLCRLNGATGQPVWQRGMSPEDQPALNGVKGYDWRAIRRAWRRTGPSVYFNDRGLTPVRGPWLVRPLPRLGGGRSPALVWAGRNDPWVLAVSARDGTVLWWFRSEDAVPGGFVCPPLLEDVDGDGTPDLVAVWAGERSGLGIEVVSGRTGKSLWKHRFAEFFLFNDWTTHFVATLDRSGKRPVLVVIAGDRLFRVDLKTRAEIGAGRPLGFKPAHRPVFTHLTRGGPLAVLLVKGKYEGSENMAVVAQSAATGDVLWQKTLPIRLTSSGTAMPSGAGLLVADLAEGGKRVVIVPDHNTNFDRGWAGIEALEAATGKSLWRSRLTPAYAGPIEGNGILHALVGPDVDGDGRRDIFTATLVWGRTFGAPRGGSEKFLVVTASSGADGKVLWRTRLPVRGNTFLDGISGLAPLRWGPLGEDGLARLVVTAVAWQRDRTQDRVDFKDRVVDTFLFAPASGRLEHTWPGVLETGTADLDGDGLPDLHGVLWNASGDSARLQAVRGVPPERWRRLGPWRTGVTGAAPADGSFPAYVSAPLPAGDLDGDGIADVLAFRPVGDDDTAGVPLHACSGKDGHRLWQAEALRTDPKKGERIGQCFLLQCHDLDGDGRPEVLFGYAIGEGNQRDYWLAVLSGRTGELRWRERIAGPYRHGNAVTLMEMGGIVADAPALVDVNGDGVLDLVLLTNTEAKTEVRALDGRTGRTLWRRHLPEIYGLGVRKAKGGAAPDVVISHRGHHNVQRDADGRERSYRLHARVTALDGRTGRPKWTWSDLKWELHGGAVALLDLGGSGRPSVCVPIEHQGERRFDLRIALLNPEGKRRHLLEFVPPWPKTDFRLWSHDLRGDGKDHLLLISEGKLRAFGGPSLRLAWEWPLPGGKGDILALLPASGKQGAVLALRAGSTAYGLDGPTGQPRWRCDGPGEPVGVLPGRGPTGLPRILFREAPSDNTVCRQALAVRPGADQFRREPAALACQGVNAGAAWACQPAGLPGVAIPVGALLASQVPVQPAGRYLPPAPTPTRPAAVADSVESLPLPWVGPARARWLQALVPGLACVGLLLYFTLKRRWWIAVLLAACCVIVPLAVLGIELKSGPDLAAGQSYSWQGWYWLWPYTLSAGGGLSLKSPLLWMGFLLLAVLGIRSLGQTTAAAPGKQ
jgi:outer membrane protein assembly factor BamB